MDLDAKFDLLFKTIERMKGRERKRRSERWSTGSEEVGGISYSVVEKRVEDRRLLRREYQGRAPRGRRCAHQVGVDASTPRRGSGIIKEEQNQPNTDRLPFFRYEWKFSLSVLLLDLNLEHLLPSGIASYNLSSTIPPMTCPVCGDNPQMWKVNCDSILMCLVSSKFIGLKLLLSIFVVMPHFVAISQISLVVLLGWVSWFSVFRFSKDRQQALIRQWFHIDKMVQIVEYVEKFDSRCISSLLMIILYCRLFCH